MLIKIVIVLFLFAIIGSLFSGLLFMFKDSSSDRMVKALTIRIGLSIVLFGLLMAGYYFGLIPAQR